MTISTTKHQVGRETEEKEIFVPPKPDRALKRLEKLIGTWRLSGRSLDSEHANIRGRVKIEWLQGGFFMAQRGWIRLGSSRIHCLEIIGYDSQTKIFPSYVYSDLSGVPSRYHWDVRGDVVKHWTNGARYVGRFSEDGSRLIGGWRPEKGEKKTHVNTYDATMFREA
jgi:hypothetical protein